MRDLYFKTLFDPGEYTCFTTSIYNTNVRPVADQCTHEFLCLNPLLPDRDTQPDPKKPKHHKDIGRKADCNVTAFRNFLIEMDNVPLFDQFPIIQKCGLPFSTSVYSGGKSIHFVVSLIEPCVNEEHYREIVDLIHRGVGKHLVDPACKNPSRLTRNPGAWRSDKDKEQKLIEVRHRVSLLDVQSWAGLRGVEPLKKNKPKPLFDGTPEAVPMWVIKFLREGAPNGEKHNTAYKAACAMARSCVPIDECRSRFAAVPGLVYNAGAQRNIESCITDAYRKVGQS